MSDCVKRIVEKTKIKPADARELVKSIDAKVKKAVSSGIDRDDAITSVIQERVEVVAQNAAKEKAQAAQNFIIAKELDNKINAFIGDGASVADAFLADLEGVNTPYAGGRASLATQQEAVKSTYLSKLFAELDGEGLTEIFNSKTMADDIGRELWAISEKVGRATDNDKAHKIASIIYDIREGQRKRKNEAGADVGEVAGNVMPQRHDTYSMYKDGKTKWIAFMRPLIDESRSFGGDYDDLDSVLGAAFDAMISGVRLNDPTINNPKLYQFSGPANLAKKLSQARQIHFKDFDSWKKWNDTYGMRDLNDGVLDAITYDADNIALLERYGTNPEAMLNSALDRAKQTHRGQIAKKNEKGINRKVKGAIDVAMGTNLVPDNPKLAAYGGFARAFNNVTMLGGAAISAIADIPIKALEYNYQGKNYLQATTQAMLDTSALFTKQEDYHRFMSMMGVYAESRVADISGRWSLQDDLGRKTMKTQRLFFKLNGLARWTDRHKFAMYRAMSHDLGRLKGVNYFDLDEPTRRLFDMYNITENDWNAARKAIQRLNDDGRDYLAPELIGDTKVKEKFTGYFLDRANEGVITPGAREQRIMSFGTQRGTPIGEAVRLTMQFKSFPVAVITKVWGRALYGKGKADIPAMVYLALMSTTFGYMAMTAKDALKNKTPKDPRKLETVYAAFTQGGGLGVMGDILLQEASFGKSLTDILAGPTAGRLSDVFKIYSSAIRGDMAEAQAARFAKGLIPGNNLPYVAVGLNNIMQQYVYEELNPGYTRRIERNMKKAYGQEVLFK